MNASTTSTTSQTELKAIIERMAELQKRIGRVPVGQQERYLDYLRAFDELSEQAHQLAHQS